ncbi:MAG: HAD-IIA family hydrolase [Micrococcales bacterium]|nr:HAD-IIA family hydrolase [Micrococcales bacterium]
MSQLLDVAVPLVEAFDLAICDLDGVCFAGSKAIGQAVEAICLARRAGVGFVFVTNNASRTPAAQAAKLVALGIEADSAMVVTAAQAGAEMLVQDLPAGAKVLVIGAEGLRDAVEQAGFEVVLAADDAPAAVMQGWGPDVCWRDLEQASYAIEAGTPYYASNLDLTRPTESGFAPGNGAMVAALVATTGVEPKASGKPQPEIFILATSRAEAASLGLAGHGPGRARRPVVLGDGLATDMAGARNAGYPGLLVLTGVSTATDAALCPPSQRPAMIAQDLRVLSQPHRAPQAQAGRWCLQGAEAWVEAGQLQLKTTGQGVSDEAIRVAVQAAWHYLDHGGQLRPADLPRALGACY